MNRTRPSATVVLFTLLLIVGTLSGQQFSPWSPRVNLGETVNSPWGDFFATVSKDGLSLYFTSSRDPNDPTRQKDWDIYVSQRATVTESWGPPQPLGANINTPFNEGAPTLSIDGHRMYFSSNRPNGFGGNDIYVSRRHDKRDDFAWEFPDNLGKGINTDANEASPAIVEDETGVVTLYFDSNRMVEGDFGPFTEDGVNNGNDIYASILGSDGTFDSAVLITELSTSSLDRQPAVRRDGLEIIFASNRPGSITVNPPPANRPLDLWVATRAKTSDPWGTPVNLGPAVNSTATEAGPALSFDGRTLYFQSIGTVGGQTFFDLYVTTRDKLKPKDVAAR